MKAHTFFTVLFIFIAITAIPFLLDPWEKIELNEKEFGFKEKNWGFLVTTGGYPSYTYYDYQKDSVPDKRVVRVLAGPGWVSMVAEVALTSSDTINFKNILQER